MEINDKFYVESKVANMIALSINALIGFCCRVISPIRKPVQVSTFVTAVSELLLFNLQNPVHKSGKCVIW